MKKKLAQINKKKLILPVLVETGDTICFAQTMFFLLEDKNSSFHPRLSLQYIDTEEELNERINIPKLWVTLGKTFKKTLLGRSFFIFTLPYINDEKESELVNSNINKIRNTLFFLWFIKDNSSFLNTYALFRDVDSSLLGHNAHILTKADGMFSTTEFYSYEFNRVLDIYEKYIRLIPDGFKPKRLIVNDNDTGSIEMQITQYNDANRIQRALDFLMNARSTYILAKKISYYVLVLECLFSANDNTDLLLKISKRVARYTTSDTVEQENRIKEIKIYYDIRSSYVHGQALANKYMKAGVLVNKSKELDNLLREILTKVIMEDSDKFTLKDKYLSAWFKTNYLI